MPRPLTLLLALTACPGPTAQIDPITPVVVPSPDPTAVPTPLPTPFVCTGWEDHLRVNDFASANTLFANCLLQDEDDLVSRMGRALTGMVLLYDSEPVREVLTACDQNPELYGPLFGPGGLIPANEAAIQGTAALTAERIIDGVTTPSSFLETVEYVWTDDDGQSITLADSYLQHEHLAVRMSSTDGLSVGDVITIDDGANHLTIGVPCDLDPTACDVESPSQPTGTVTVVEVPAQNGDLVVDIDLYAPMPCDACTTSTMHVTGRVTDDVSDFEAVARALPFVDALDSGRCSTSEHCDYRTSFITALADVCPAGTATIGTTNARLAGELFASFADDFELVGADPSFTMTWPSGGLFFVESDLQFNQADVLMLAGLARGMAGSIALASSYDVIEADATFGSRGETYTAPDFQETCGTDDYWGVSVAALAADLDANLGAIRTDADFAQAQTQLLSAFTDFAAGVSATPEGTGLLDFSESAAWSAMLASDLDVVVASLEGTDGTLATADQYSITLSAFFADPTDREDALADLQVTELFTTGLDDDDDCEIELVPAETGDWWIQDAGPLHVTDAGLHDGQLPSWIEDFQGVLDARDIPLWADDSIHALYEDYTYVP